MNIKKNSSDRIVTRASTILILIIVFLVVYTGLYKVMNSEVFQNIIENSITMLIVVSILLLFGIINHVKRGSKKFGGTENLKPKANLNTQISGFSDLFSGEEQKLIQNMPLETTGVLSYFATSLFDINKLDDALWHISEHCISQLQLEDFVMYYMDEEKNVLIQKAAYVNNNYGKDKIINPIEIPLGKGVVGQVAASGVYECINDVTKYKRCITDDTSCRSELAVPIMIDDKVIGVLDSEHSQEEFFNENHILLFQLIAKLTAKKLAQINSKNTTNITKDNLYFKELHFLMKEAKIYRDSSLGLDSISKMLKISSNYLSQMVNKLSGTNFSDYVNSFRIEDAKSKLKDSKFTNYTILDIGLESGFNSKSTFYSAFKKHTGISPKEYRETP